MNITSITLYKTPLSSEYKNVYMHENGNIINNFNILFPNVNIPFGNKSYRQTDSGMVIVINANYDDIYEYNYAIVYSVDNGISKQTFFFITNHGLIANNPSCTELTLKYDAWTNNNNLLLTNSKKSKTLCRHMSECFLYSEDANSSTYKFIPYLTDELQVTNKIQNRRMLPFTSSTIPVNILWAKIRLNPDGLNYDPLSAPSQIRANISNISNILLSISSPIIYIPYALIDIRTGELYDDIEYPSLYSFVFRENGQIYPVTMQTKNYNNNLFFEHENIMSIELTYHSPFIVNIEGENNNNKRFVCDSIIQTYTEGDTTYFYSGMARLSTGMTPNYVVKGYNTNGSKFYPYYIMGYQSNFKTRNNTRILNYFSRTITINAEENKDLSFSIASEEDIVKYLSRPKFFPYNYTNIIVNNKAFTIPIEQDYSTIKIDYSYENGGQVKYTLTVNDDFNNELLRLPPIYAESQGELIRGIDSFDYFIRNNGSKLLAQSVSAIVTKNIAQGVDVITSLIDNAKKLDQLHMPSQLGTDDIQYQDSMWIENQTMLNGSQFKSFVDKIHHYGYNVNMETNPLELTKSVFNYIQTQDCELPSVTNNIHRNELQNSFNKGITIWRINEDTMRTQQRRNVLKTFNTSILNIDNSIFERLN